jgi:predicted heme/steroid binding protein
MKIFTVLLLLLSVGCAANISPSSVAPISSSVQSDQQITSSSVASALPSSSVSSAPAPSSVASSSVSSAPVSSSSSSTEIELTLEELKQFDGKGGRKAYIAVGGTIYDVTGNGNWSGGNHNGFEAGRDLTEAMDTQSPHGRSKLAGLPIVGKIKS